MIGTRVKFNCVMGTYAIEFTNKTQKNILIVAEVQHVMPTKLLCKVIQDIFAKHRCYCMAIKFSYIYLTLLYSAVLVVFCTT